MRLQGIKVPDGPPCNCAYCRHDYRIIGIKKTRKFYVSEINKLKKQLKKLRDGGIKYGYLGDYKQESPEIQKLRNEYAVIEENLSWTQYLKYELWKIKRGYSKGR